MGARGKISGDGAVFLLVDPVPLTPETELVAALRLTADPPLAWTEAAAMIPATLGDLAELEPLLASDEFRSRFDADAAAALSAAGLPATTPVVAAMRELLRAA
jgi:hypothetical protein